MSQITESTDYIDAYKNLVIKEALYNSRKTQLDYIRAGFGLCSIEGWAAMAITSVDICQGLCRTPTTVEEILDELDPGFILRLFLLSFFYLKYIIISSLHLRNKHYSIRGLD